MTDYKITNTPFGRDPIAELSEALPRARRTRITVSWVNTGASIAVFAQLCRCGFDVDRQPGLRALASLPSATWSRENAEITLLEPTPGINRDSGCYVNGVDRVVNDHCS